MPLYKGSTLIAGERGSGDQNIEFKFLKATSGNADDIRELTDAWKWRSLKISIICVTVQNALLFGIINSSSTNTIILSASAFSGRSNGSSYTTLSNITKKLNLTLSSNGQSVSAYSISDVSTNTDITLLDTDVNYSTPYTPLYEGSPTTKKYVDSAITTALENFKFADFTVVVWDGKSSTENSNNIALFQEALNDYNNDNKTILVLRANGSNAEFNPQVYVLSSKESKNPSSSNTYVLWSDPIITSSSGNSNGQITNLRNKLTITVDASTKKTVTKIESSDLNVTSTFLETNKNYSTPYTPLYNGSPATKKYVDDKETALSTRITTNATNISTNTGNISTLQTNVSGLDTRLTTAEGDIDDLETDVSDIKANYAKKSDLTPINNDITAIKTKNTQQDTAISGLQTTVGTHSQNISDLQDADISINNDIDLIKTKNDSQDTEIGKLKTADTNIRSDIENLTEQVNTNTGNILTNMQNIQAVRESTATNKGDIDTLKSRVSDAESDISDNASAISTLQTNLGTTNTNLSNLADRVTTNEGDILSLKNKTDTTNTNLSNLSSQVSTNATNIQTNATAISTVDGRVDATNVNVQKNADDIAAILEGTAEIPTVADAEHAGDADKLGGQLPGYYATKTDLNSYLPLTGGTVNGLVKILGTAQDNSLMVRGIRGSSADGSAADALYLNYGNNQPVYINGTNVVYHAGNIPSASTTLKGIVQLNNTYTSTSTVLAPTANALKSSHDTLNTKIDNHAADTNLHLTQTDRTILNKANKFKGYYETETALNNAHPTGEAGDYAIVNSTDTMWIWDLDKEGGAGWKDGAGKGSVVSVNNMTGEVVLTKLNIGLGNVDNTSDLNKPVSTATQNALDLKVNKAGDTMTGKLIVPKVETGTNEANYFQSRKFRGEGDAGTYYHAIDFGYTNHDQVDFYEYGGTWIFHKHTGAAKDAGDTIVGTINSNGWVGGAQLSGTPTAPTAAAGTNTTQIATTAFVTNATTTLGNNKVDRAGDTMTGNLIVERGTSDQPLIAISNGNYEMGLMIGSEGINRGLRDITNNRWLLYVGNEAGTALVADTTLKVNNATDSTSSTTGSLITTGGLGIAKSANIGTTITAGTAVTAGTDLKTGSGVVNYNDKAYIKYNETDECLEFVFA